jgi:hypothetical protein
MGLAVLTIYSQRLQTRVHGRHLHMGPAVAADALDPDGRCANEAAGLCARANARQAHTRHEEGSGGDPCMYAMPTAPAAAA